MDAAGWQKHKNLPLQGKTPKTGVSAVSIVP